MEGAPPNDRLALREYLVTFPGSTGSKVLCQNKRRATTKQISTPLFRCVGTRDNPNVVLVKVGRVFRPCQLEIVLELAPTTRRPSTSSPVLLPVPRRLFGGVVQSGRLG